MAQDDMFVVMYKIIAYLYDCMKNDAEPDFNKWNSDAMNVPHAYWMNVVEQLVEHGYVTGTTIIRTSSGLIIRPIDPKVTMEGVQFAQENSMMAKAARFLKDAKASIPFI